MKLSYTLFDLENTIAKDLLEIGAVNFRPEELYTFTSGMRSPIYVDVRRMLGVPFVRAHLGSLGSSFIYNHVGSKNFSIIAGGETAGIPIATIMAERINKPLCYIRKAPKDFGRGNQIEGLSEEELAEGRRFLLCEDLCTDGGSKMMFIKAIRRSGNMCTDVFTVFSYNIFGATELLKEDGITLHHMVDIHKLIEVAEDLGMWNAKVIGGVKQFIEKNCASADFLPQSIPEDSKAHGGRIQEDASEE